MPTKITTHGDAKPEVAWLCGDDWALPSQVLALEAWLGEHAATLGKGRYTADIGYSPRPGAGGGGAAISPLMMRTMADLGMTLFLSEYPPMHDDAAAATPET